MPGIFPDEDSPAQREMHDSIGSDRFKLVAAVAAIAAAVGIVVAAIVGL